MPEILVDLYECECKLIFSADSGEILSCCPKCKSENITGVGKGRIEGIIEH